MRHSGLLSYQTMKCPQKRVNSSGDRDSLDGARAAAAARAKRHKIGGSKDNRGRHNAATDRRYI